MSHLGCDLELYFSFAGLVSKDVLTKSDPMAEVLLETRGRREHVLSTKPLKNVNEGSWPESARVHFRFEEMQTLTVRVSDSDGGRTSKDFLGETSLKLGDIMGSMGQKKTAQLVDRSHPRRNCGTLTVTAEKAAGGSSGSFEFELRGIKLESKDWGGFGKSDPYFLVQRNISSNWNTVLQSEYIKNDCNPRWKRQVIPLEKLCRGDLNEKLQIAVFDHDEGSSPDLIGNCQVSVNDFFEMSRSGRQIPLVHPPTKRKYQKSSYKNSGLLQCVLAQVKPSPTSRMLDYINGGVRLSLSVAIDFTASNGDVRSPQSLHFFQPGGTLNQYMNAIYAVGQILQPYDSDGMIAAYGFGGVYQGHTSHCFPLNGNLTNPEVHGVDGVMQAYELSLCSVALSGPTYFAPLLSVVNQAIFNPEISQQAQEYNILLILTDGAIMDMQETVNEVVKGSDQAISIIIVGIGNADFGLMETLDADDTTLRSSNGRKASRDIVQFVPFNKCHGNGEELARRVLAEIPAQMVSFFESRHIVPNISRSVPSIPDAGATIVSNPGDQAQLASAGKAVLQQAYAL